VHGTPDSTLLKNEVREDIIAYLKGLTVADIQGVRGFQNLREQLEDRARIRGRGAILGLLIGGFVIE
jgi:flagellar FliL protein